MKFESKTYVCNDLTNAQITTYKFQDGFFLELVMGGQVLTTTLSEFEPEELMEIRRFISDILDEKANTEVQKR